MGIRGPQDARLHSAWVVMDRIDTACDMRHSMPRKQMYYPPLTRDGAGPHRSLNGSVAY